MLNAARRSLQGPKVKPRRRSSLSAAKKRQRLQRLRRQEARLAKEFESIIKPWWLAICNLRTELGKLCLKQPPERRRFQNRRLIKTLCAEFRSSPKARKSALMSYWLFCGSPFEDRLPYKEARQQHYAELKARGLSKQFGPTKLQRKRNTVAIAKEFMFRLDSLASWIEAQESWIFWRGLQRVPSAWNRHDPKARQRALEANIIRQMRTITNELPDWIISDFVKGFRRWNSSDWAKILKASARSAEGEQEDDLKLEAWVWWRYPIFSRYRWSTSEVCRAAREKLGNIHHVNHEAAFQSFWVRRGLRFTGKRRRRERPPLWNFVISRQAPRNVSLRYPLLI